MTNPPLTSQVDHVVFAVNPRAGPRSAQSRVEQLLASLAARGFKCEILGNLDEAADRANELYRRGSLRALVAVGGDGTVAEAVNRTLPGLPLAVLPAGTENLVARHLGIDPRPEALANVVAGGRVVTLDAGLANGRLFLVMASSGFDADVVRRFHDRRRGHIRRFDYVQAICEAVCEYPFPEIRIYWDEDRAEAESGRRGTIESRWMFAFNLPRYGGGLGFAPQADARDGRLDVCTFRRGGLWHGLRYASMVYRGRHQESSDCRMIRTRRLHADSDRPVPYQLDGDPGGMLPLDLEVLPGRVSLLVDAERLRSGGSPP